MIDIFLQDFRYAARSLRGRWLFAAVTVLTLGLGIGVVTALFAVVDAALLQPIATDQDHLVRIWKWDTGRGHARHPLTYPEFLAWREQARTLEALAAINYADNNPFALEVEGQPVAVSVTPVSANFFQVVHGGAPLHGRWFQPLDERAGAELVVVVSERFWRRVARADPAIVGRRLAWGGGRDDRTLVVVGVAPSDVKLPLSTDAWVPIAPFFKAAGHPVDTATHRLSQFELIGRVARGVSAEEAGAELAVLHRRMIDQFPDDYRPMQVAVTPLLNTILGDTRQVLLFLFAAAGLVFVIGGVNVAALLLMRASSRRKELAVRVALGASRWRLARQTLTESLLLGMAGAVCGLVFTRLFLGIAQWMAPGDVPRIEDAALDVRVLAFCVVASLGWVLTLGTAPIWSRPSLQTSPWLGSSALSSRGEPGTRALRAFTIAEIASAVVVAISAGLLVRSFLHLQGIDRGFDSSNLAVVEILLPKLGYPDAGTRLAFYEQLLPKLTALPGVLSASPDHMGPGSGNVGLGAAMIFDGQSPQEAAKNPWASWEPVTPSYFRTLGIPVIRGRSFTLADSRDGAPVAVVSDAVARRYWPSQDPLGKRLRLASEFPWATVVGVAADLRYRELTRNWLTVYFPAAQCFFFDPGSVAVRTASSPETIVPAIREAVRAQEPHAAFASVSTMDALLARELARPRTALTVTALFALMAILLAAVGVYGVISYEVVQRRGELAVRSALGATPSRIFQTVALRSLTLGAAGIAVGAAAAAYATHSLRSLLFGVAPYDPGSFAIGASVLFCIVLLASLLPARRAAAADPMSALRLE